MIKDQSLADAVRAILDQEDDLEKFQSVKERKAFYDRAEKEIPNFPRKSIESTFSRLLKQKLKAAGKETEGYSQKPQQKRFASKLDIQTSTAEAQTDAAGPSMQNPAGQKVQAPPKEYPLEPVAGGIDSFFSAFFEEYPELTQREREDISGCLNMSFGGVLETHDKFRAAIGVVGILGIYGGRIKRARTAGKEKKAKREHIEKKEDEPAESKPAVQAPKHEITAADKERFEQEYQTYQQEQMSEIVTDT